MSPSADATFLRRVMFADAAATAATGALLAGAAGALGPLFGLSPSLLRGAGLSLLPFAALVALLAARRAPPRLAVWAVILYNALWALDSLLLLLTARVEPTALGHAFVAAQALVVGAFAQAEFVGLRRARAALKLPRFVHAGDDGVYRRFQ